MLANRPTIKLLLLTIKLEKNGAAKLNIITLGVKDLEKALEFYERGLGWKRSVASQGDIVFFPLGGIILALYPYHLLAEDITINDDGKGFAGITLAINTKSENETDDIFTLVQSLGATILKPAQKFFGGGYSGYFKDPSMDIFLK